MTFSSFCVYVCVSFWNCDICGKERAVTHAISFFWKHTGNCQSYFSFQGTHQPAQGSFLILFISFPLHPSSPFSFPLNSLMCLIYILELCVHPFVLCYFECVYFIYINIIVVQLSLFSVNTTLSCIYLVDSNYSVCMHCILFDSLRNKHLSYPQFAVITATL